MHLAVQTLICGIALFAFGLANMQIHLRSFADLNVKMNLKYFKLDITCE